MTGAPISGLYCPEAIGSLAIRPIGNLVCTSTIKFLRGTQSFSWSFGSGLQFPRFQAEAKRLSS
jgi:hypothetical protein